MEKETEPKRLIMHVDMDAFFAAIEQLDHPELRDKPVIVGARPGTRGVVATCSYEARRFGIRSAMPISEAYARCPQGHYVRPRMKRYASVSRDVMNALESVSPVIEPVSIDEAFIDVSGLEDLWGRPGEIGRRAKDAIADATGLTASVGIGPNRLIAKIASDRDKPDGLTVVSPGDVLAFLAPLDVTCLRGVGRILGQRLARLGIRTVTDLRRWSVEKLIAHFGRSTGEMLHRQSRGIASDVVGLKEERKSISKETTFNEDVQNLEILRNTMQSQAAEVGRLARSQSLCGRCVSIKVRLEGFETHTRSRTLENPVDCDNEIFRVGWDLFSTSRFPGRRVRLIGIGLSLLERERQLGLFAPEETMRKVMDVKDRIMTRFGKNALGFRTRDEGDKEGA
jgi:DNA polymerase-4